MAAFKVSLTVEIDAETHKQAAELFRASMTADYPFLDLAYDVVGIGPRSGNAPTAGHFELPGLAVEAPRMLVLSTKHISEATVSALENGTGHLPSGIAVRDHGWIIPIYDQWDGEDEDEKVPADLGAIRDFAVSIGCTWICLDSDGDILAGLPTFDW